MSAELLIDPARDAMSSATELALTHLVGLLAPTTSPAELSVALAAVGDALRLGLSTDANVRRALGSLPIAQLASAVQFLAEEASAFPLPLGDEAVEPDSQLAYWVQRRDHLESVVRACARSLLPRGQGLADLPAYPALRDALQALDVRLGSSLGRAKVIAMLGDRVALQAPGGWTDQLSEHAADETGSAFESSAPAEPTPLFEAPSTALVLSYVRDGAAAGALERLAAQDAAYAERLEQQIAAHRGLGEPVSLVARRWFARRDQAAAAIEGAAVAVPLFPAVARAAASSAAQDQPFEAMLGWLHPLQASARLETRGDEVEVQLFAEPGVLRRVELGPTIVEVSAVAAVPVSIRCPRAARIRLRVEGAGGVFEVTLTEEA